MTDTPRPADIRAAVHDTTTLLIERVRAGDASAADAFVERYAPFLERIGRGRLPAWARSVAETADIVQDTLLRTLRRLPDVEARGDAALRAYLRQALINRVRDEVRRAEVIGPLRSIDPDMPGTQTSPLSRAISRQDLERYEAALQDLRPDDRNAIIGRVELGYSYEELAAMLDRPSAEAARLAVRRALLRLADVMQQRRTPPSTRKG